MLTMHQAAANGNITIFSFANFTGIPDEFGGYVDNPLLKNMSVDKTDTNILDYITI